MLRYRGAYGMTWTTLRGQCLARSSDNMVSAIHLWDGTGGILPGGRAGWDYRPALPLNNMRAGHTPFLRRAYRPTFTAGKPGANCPS